MNDLLTAAQKRAANKMAKEMFDRNLREALEGEVSRLVYRYVRSMRKDLEQLVQQELAKAVKKELSRMLSKAAKEMYLGWDG